VEKTDESVLVELVSLWQFHRADGHEASPAELCRDRPELEPELRRRIDALQHFDQLAAALPVQAGSYQQVERACQEFTDEWDGGIRPNLSAYLDRADADAQPTLLRNLLHQEILHRRQQAEAPSAEEYAARFPQHASLIRQVFLESSTFSTHANTSAPQVKGAKIPLARRLGDYQLLGELGRGGMGVVFEAVHLRRGHRVALKTLPMVDGEALHRFKREFRALADVSHPNLIGLHTLEVDGLQWFFTMDLLPGVDFLSHVRPGGRLDEARLRAALAQLVSGVMALHARQMVHRDLKPSNVMVTEQGRVVLLDFGLIAQLERAEGSGSVGKIAGTPSYMAPEQAAGQRVAPAADWYAVGVMLYEALAGRLPFRGSLYRLLMDKQRLDAPPLPDDGSVPSDLARLSRRLLAREPADRPDALQIAGFVSSQIKVETASPSGESVRLVGREQHLAELEAAYRTVKERQEPLTLFIAGRSGEGKSSLADHFLAPLRRNPRLAVMAGRCYDRESVPFKALDSLIDALSSFLRSLPSEDAALLMPDDIGTLAQVFPVLQRVEVVAKASDPRLAGLDEQQVRGRAFRALRSFLMRVSRRALVVWFIDDLQWGDADSAEALFEVLRPPEAPPLLFLGAYRSDETKGSAFLTMWKELQRKHGVSFADREVKVGPLTVEECTQLVLDVLGKDTEVVRRRAAEFAQETRGNPFLLIELVGCFDADADSFEPMPLHEALARKLGRLPAEAGALLEVVAISGQPLSLEEASRTAGHELPPVATLTRMRNERLLRLVGPENSPHLDTYHDRVRESVLNQMEDARCRSLHRALADLIEKTGEGLPEEFVAALERDDRQYQPAAIPRVYDLAYHYDAAGETRKARIYALLAAQQARRQSALEVAVNNYAIAKRNADQTVPAARYRIAEGYSEALMLLGRYDEADAELRDVADLGAKVEKKARIEGIQGEIANKQGCMDKSILLYEQGLRCLGNWVPKTLPGILYGVLRETLIQSWHSLWPRRLHRQALNEQRELTILFFERVTNSYAFQCTPRVIWANLAGMNRAELLPPSALLARSYAHHACLLSMLIRWPTRRARYAEKARTLASKFDDLLARAHCANFEGISLCASARYEEALTHLNEAMQGFEKAGDLWQVNLTHFHKARCYYGLGNLAEAVAEARWTFASSARLGDSRTLCSSYLWVRASKGNVAFEELKSCLPCRPDDIMSTVHGLMAEGYWHSFHDRTKEALGLFEQAAALVRKSLCLNFHTSAVLPGLVSALRLHADAVQHNDAAHAQQLRRRAYRLTKWATRITRLFPTAHPQSLRERSLILSKYGKTKKALKYADKSCAVAEAQKAKYEHAQSLLVRGRLAKQLGLPEADEQIRTAEARLDALERPVRARANTSLSPRA
jgi:serine/threonine protein kinase/tetratricopeptide (TPR) repeat protein